MKKLGEFRYFPKINEKYGKWKILSEETIKKGRKLYWLVECECGKQKLLESHTLRNGVTKSCMKCAKSKLSSIEEYFNRIKRRAKTSNFEFNLDLEYIQELLENQNYKCALSGLDIELYKLSSSDTKQSASLDRIDNSKGYTKGNIQWLHKIVNMMKHIQDQKEFIEICKKIAQNQ